VIKSKEINCDKYIDFYNMDLFIVNTPRQSKISPITLGIAACSLFGVWVLSKFLSSNDEDSDRDAFENK